MKKNASFQATVSEAGRLQWSDWWMSQWVGSSKKGQGKVAPKDTHQTSICLFQLSSAFTVPTFQHAIML